MSRVEPAGIGIAGIEIAGTDSVELGAGNIVSVQAVGCFLLRRLRELEARLPVEHQVSDHRRKSPRPCFISITFEGVVGDVLS